MQPPGIASEMPPSLYVTIGDRITNRLSDACAQHQVWAVFNVLEKADVSGEHAYNVSYLVNHEGEVVLKQKKINPFVPTENSRAGEALSVCKGPRESTIGIMTCYDGDFPGGRPCIGCIRSERPLATIQLYGAVFGAMGFRQ